MMHENVVRLESILENFKVDGDLLGGPDGQHFWHDSISYHGTVECTDQKPDLYSFDHVYAFESNQREFHHDSIPFESSIVGSHTSCSRI